MIHSFRPNKDTLLFNIKNIPLHLFNFIFIHLQKGGYTPYYIFKEWNSIRPFIGVSSMISSSMPNSRATSRKMVA